MTDWAEHARCRGMNPDIFHPLREERHGEPSNSETAHAKAICADCQVRTECLNYALDNYEKVGVWGGTSGRERRQIWRKRAATARRNNTPTTRAPKPIPPARPDQCGTLTGYRNHHARNETPCEPCRNANAAYLRDWRQRERNPTR